MQSSHPQNRQGSAAWLAPYIGISDDFMAIIVGLHQSGVSVTSLDHAIAEAGQDLPRMIHRFLEMARGLKDARLWNQDWVAALGRIELAVAAQRSANEEASAGR
jgi:hypothetical protein